MMHGILSFLTSSSDEEARLLRDRYIFKVIPMLNPGTKLYYTICVYVCMYVCMYVYVCAVCIYILYINVEAYFTGIIPYMYVSILYTPHVYIDN